MSNEDRLRWDGRYADRPPVSVNEVCLPEVFAPFADSFPTDGNGLEVACGRGAAAVWLARRGMQVMGVDVSATAIAAARVLADAYAPAGSCDFVVADLNDGLPPGPPADVVLCHRFRDSRLDGAIVDRLAPGGLLAISALSEVGADPGPFRVRAGELRSAFSALDVIADGEAEGQAWLFARKDRGGN